MATTRASPTLTSIDGASREVVSGGSATSTAPGPRSSNAMESVDATAVVSRKSSCSPFDLLQGMRMTASCRGSSMRERASQNRAQRLAKSQEIQRAPSASRQLLSGVTDGFNFLPFGGATGPARRKARFACSGLRAAGSRTVRPRELHQPRGSALTLNNGDRSTRWLRCAMSLVDRIAIWSHASTSLRSLRRKPCAALPQMLQIVGPVVHHPSALGNKLCPVIRGAERS